jgi:hypothetical protein
MTKRRYSEDTDYEVFIMIYEDNDYELIVQNTRVEMEI